MSKELKVSKEEKKQLVESRMKNIAREVYNQELNLKMYAAYGERPDVVAATQGNIDKQTKAYEALETELAFVEALAE